MDKRTDGRTDERAFEGTGHLLTPRRPYARYVLPGTDPRTKVTRPAIGRGYCDARNIFIPKVRIVSPAATTCTKDQPLGVAPLRAAFYIFHFRDRGRGGGDGGDTGRGQQGDAVARSITKRNFRAVAAGAIFRPRARSEGDRTRWTFNDVLDINRLPRARHKGKESLVSVTQNGFRVINAAKRNVARSRRCLQGNDGSIINEITWYSPSDSHPIRMRMLCSGLLKREIERDDESPAQLIITTTDNNNNANRGDSFTRNSLSRSVHAIVSNETPLRDESLLLER